MAGCGAPPVDAIEEVRGRPKAEGPKVHIGFRLPADVVESLKASGPNYNRRVEEALRAAGFGAKASAAKQRAAKQGQSALSANEGHERVESDAGAKM
jgi:hypothetical protein